MKRRNFVKASLLASPLILSESKGKNSKKGGAASSLKLSLNAYSFNAQLKSGETNLFELIDFCKTNGFDAIDPTGYYFPGYPDVPDDAYIYEFKRRAFLAGLEISGTGVRNDFANADEKKLQNDLKLIEEWCIVSSKLGSPILRVFPGKEIKDGRDKGEVLDQVIEELKKACQIGEKYGVMMALQNHNDFLISSHEILKVLKAVNSQWLGLHLDIGSLAFRDPYQEIQSLIDFAITWQIKQLVWVNGKKVPVNYDNLMEIILGSDYRGYLPLETLNTDPRTNLPLMIQEMRKRM